jgi:hypothetical protein
MEQEQIRQYKQIASYDKKAAKRYLEALENFQDSVNSGTYRKKSAYSKSDLSNWLINYFTNSLPRKWVDADMLWKVCPFEIEPIRFKNSFRRIALQLEEQGLVKISNNLRKFRVRRSNYV